MPMHAFDDTFSALQVKSMHDDLAQRILQACNVVLTFARNMPYSHVLLLVATL